jgi:hypothetical protein
VIDDLLALREQCRLVPLLGNHEEMMLNFLDRNRLPRHPPLPNQSKLVINEHAPRIKFATAHDKVPHLEPYPRTVCREGDHPRRMVPGTFCSEDSAK